jgi:hypothetical protein
MVCNSFCFIWINAWSRSLTRSSVSSSPIDKRMRLSATPAALLFPAGIDLCVMLAGWQSKLLIPPKLSASLKSWVDLTNSPEALRLFCRHFVVVVRFQTRVKNLIYIRVLLKKLRHLLSAGTMLPDP